MTDNRDGVVDPLEGVVDPRAVKELALARDRIEIQRKLQSLPEFPPMLPFWRDSLSLRTEGFGNEIVLIKKSTIDRIEHLSDNECRILGRGFLFVVKDKSAADFLVWMHSDPFGG